MRRAASIAALALLSACSSGPVYLDNPRIRDDRLANRQFQHDTVACKAVTYGAPMPAPRWYDERRTVYTVYGVSLQDDRGITQRYVVAVPEEDSYDALKRSSAKLGFALGQMMGRQRNYLECMNTLGWTEESGDQEEVSDSLPP